MAANDDCDNGGNSPFLNPNAPIEKHSRRLPQWHQDDVYFFVTWHMGDALPRMKLEALREERAQWIVAHPKPWNRETEAAYSELFIERVDKWLDAGYGSCILRAPEYARLVGDAIQHFDEVRYTLDCFVVMPNHVHTLFRLFGPYKLDQTVKSWKGYTAREINRMRGISGPFWQEEYWDRIVRNADDLEKYRSYIERNPSEAGIKPGEYLYFTRINAA